ncbi:hypothetical protein M011DRAFT_475325 [Sporormia fimetaria CBS 119925]|uniref:Chlorophyllase n=1 Tax=Sporormia fimetaria CBS 119925 TaxID=1340428 RepID=A0A6A6VHB0_9PLEO|nr:hypothetical protein M011DRAFT_475325 [Sporormia fimetaria CBS 119925]
MHPLLLPLLLSPLLTHALPTPQNQPGTFPPTGDGTYAGGIFSISLTDLPRYIPPGPDGGTETPRADGQRTSGSGPYPAQMTTDPTLPGHTIFAPRTPPAGNISLPFIAWGNGACVLNPTQYQNLLTEIASYGYVIAADGTPNGSSGTEQQSKVQDMRESLDWAVAGKAAKYGNVDVQKITTAGHSCGGLEAMSTAYRDPRVKRIMMFNIAIFQDEKRYLLQEIKVPVAYLIGGKSDMGYENSAKDYARLNPGLPKLRANLDTGHQGTFRATNGGKQGKAAVAYLEWQWRGNMTARDVILKPESPGSLVKDNWVVESANWDLV